MDAFPLQGIGEADAAETAAAATLGDLRRRAQEALLQSLRDSSLAEALQRAQPSSVDDASGPFDPRVSSEWTQPPLQPEALGGQPAPPDSILQGLRSRAARGLLASLHDGTLQRCLHGAAQTARQNSNEPVEVGYEDRSASEGGSASDASGSVARAVVANSLSLADWARKGTGSSPMSSPGPGSPNLKQYEKEQLQECVQQLQEFVQKEGGSASSQDAATVDRVDQLPKQSDEEAERQRQEQLKKDEEMEQQRRLEGERLKKEEEERLKKAEEERQQKELEEKLRREEEEKLRQEEEERQRKEKEEQLQREQEEKLRQEEEERQRKEKEEQLQREQEEKLRQEEEERKRIEEEEQAQKVLEEQMRLEEEERKRKEKEEQLRKEEEERSRQEEEEKLRKQEEERRQQEEEERQQKEKEEQLQKEADEKLRAEEEDRQRKEREEQLQREQEEQQKREQEEKERREQEEQLQKEQAEAAEKLRQEQEAEKAAAQASEQEEEVEQLPKSLEPVSKPQQEGAEKAQLQVATEGENAATKDASFGDDDDDEEDEEDEHFERPPGGYDGEDLRKFARDSLIAANEDGTLFSALEAVQTPRGEEAERESVRSELPHELDAWAKTVLRTFADESGSGWTPGMKRRDTLTISQLFGLSGMGRQKSLRLSVDSSASQGRQSLVPKLNMSKVRMGYEWEEESSNPTASETHASFHEHSDAGKKAPVPHLNLAQVQHSETGGTAITGKTVSSEATMGHVEGVPKKLTRSTTAPMPQDKNRPQGRRGSMTKTDSEDWQGGDFRHSKSLDGVVQGGPIGLMRSQSLNGRAHSASELRYGGNPVPPDYRYPLPPFDEAAGAPWKGPIRMAVVSPAGADALRTVCTKVDAAGSVVFEPSQKSKKMALVRLPPVKQGGKSKKQAGSSLGLTKGGRQVGPLISHVHAHHHYHYHIHPKGGVVKTVVESVVTSH